MTITRYNPWVSQQGKLQEEIKGVFDRFFNGDDTDQSTSSPASGRRASTSRKRTSAS
jgi:hypothetical protein